MQESSAITEALRAGARLRDKVIVLSVDAARDAAQIDAIAAELALARALGARVLAVAPAGEGPQPLDAQGPGLKLLAAIERHGERGVLLPATGLVTIHRIPAAAAASSPGVPTMIPVANATILLHLLALGYVPVVYAPAVDATGAAVELATATLAAFVAQFTGAAMLLLSPGEAPPVAVPGLPPLSAIVVTPASPGRLIAEMLQHAPSLPVAAPAQTSVSAGSLGGNPIFSKTPAPR
jgi:hypothetical protein